MLVFYQPALCERYKTCLSVNHKHRLRSEADTNRMEKQQDVMMEKRQRDVMMEKQNSVMIESLLQSIEVTSEDVISHDGPVFSDSFPEIDMKTAKWIDRQLDWQDAVSFSFLMVEKVEIALKLSR